MGWWGGWVYADGVGRDDVGWCRVVEDGRVAGWGGAGCGVGLGDGGITTMGDDDDGGWWWWCRMLIVDHISDGWSC